MNEKAVKDNKSYLNALREAAMMHENLDDVVKESISIHDSYASSLGTTGSVTDMLKAKFKNVGMSISGVAKSIGALALNAASITLISAAIGLVVKGIEYVATYKKRVKEAGLESKNAIDDIVSTYNKKANSIKGFGQKFVEDTKEIKTTEDSIESLSKKYAQLSKGVDLSTNENNNLSTEEYQQYLEINNEIAEQFPSIVSGYDEQGNAILNLGNNASETATKLKDLLDVQRMSANAGISDELQTQYEGVVEEYKEIDLEWKNAKAKSNRSEEYVSELSNLLNGSGAEFNLLENRSKIARALQDKGIAYKLYNAKDSDGKTEYGISTDLTAERTRREIAKMITKAEKTSAKDLQDANVLELKLKDSINSLMPSIKGFIETSSAFSELDNSLQKSILNGVQNSDVLDLEGMIKEKGKDASLEDVIYNEILSPIDRLSKENQLSLVSIFDLDKSKMTLDQYVTSVDEALSSMPEADQKHWKKVLGIESMEKTFEEYEDVVGDALTGGKGKLDGLTTSDMQIAYDLVVNDGFSGTFNELKNEIAKRKEEIIDLNATPLLNSADSAAETENQGSSYDKMREYLTKGKELAEKGLYGTDDFKTIAKMFSLSGAEDKANWEENLPKMERYFTEGKSGIDSFLKDLTNKGLADEVKGNWDFTEVAKDYDKAAKSMGMSTETFLAVFGKMNEYGIETNFFVSEEEGKSKIKGLYSELNEAEKELYELENDPTYTNNTAIESKKKEIQSLKEEINEAIDALNKLLGKTYEDYEQEYQMAEAGVMGQLQSYNSNLGENESVDKMMYNQIQSIADQYNIELYTDNKTQEVSVVYDVKDEELKESKNDLELIKEKSNEGYTVKIDAKNTKLIEQIEDFNENLPEGETKIKYIIDKEENTVENTEKNETKKTEEIKYYKVDYGDMLTAEQRFEALRKKSEEGYTVKVNADDTELISMINTYNAGGGNTKINFETYTDTEEAFNRVKEIDTYEIKKKTVDIATSGYKKVKEALQTLEDFDLTEKTLEVALTYGISYVVDKSGLPKSGGKDDKKKDKKGKFNGTFNANGTFLNGTSAYAYGTKNVSITKDQESLINEVGKEGVVRNGKLHVYNNGYPTKIKLKRGDIVFNHKQMEELEKNGKVTGSHAKIVGGSTAFAHGTVDELPAFAKGSSSKKSSGEKKTKLEKALEKLGKKFDWLEIRLSRLGEASDRIANRISDFITITKKASLLRQQMKSTNKEQWANYNGYYEYMQNANEVARKTKAAVNSKQKKFLTKAFEKVRNGTINISSISNDNIRSAVEEYKKYYDAAIQCKDAIEELRQEQLELYKELISLPIERANKKIDDLKRNFNTLGKRIHRFNEEITSAQLSVAESGESAVAALAKTQNNKVQWAKRQYDNAKTKKEKREAYAVWKQAETEAKMVNKYKDKPLYEYQNALAEEQVAIAEKENNANQIAYNTTIKNRRNKRKNVDDAKATRDAKRKKLKNSKTWKKLSKSQKKAVENGKIMSLEGLSGQALKDAKAYNNAVRNLTQQTREYNIALDVEAEAAENAQISQAEMVEAQIELAKTKFENVKNYYDMEIEYLDALASKYENQRKLAEALGQSVSESTLKGEESYYNDKLTKLQEERVKLQEELNDATQNGIKKDSQEYRELEQQLIEVDNEIADVQVSLIELHNEMLEIKYENMFDKHIEDAERFRNKLDTIQGLITDEMMYNDDGSLTEYGQAALSLEYQQYESALEDINRLNEKRKQIEEDYNNGLFESEEQYQEAVKETEDQMMDAVQTAASSRQQILDIVTKAAEKELEALNEVIDARKEALQKKKDYYEWDKQLKSKNKEINLLKQQIAALDGVADAESRAKKARLEAELKEQQEELNDSIQEHLFELQIEGLDDLKETLQKNYEDYVEELARNLDEIEKIMADVGVSVNNAANTVETAIDRILESYGVEKAPEHNKTEEPVTDNNNNNNNVEMGQMKEGSSGSLNGLSKEPLEDIEKPEESTIIKTEDGTVISSGVTSVSAKDVTLKGSTSSQLDKKIDGSYAKGTTYVPKNGLYEINEKGSEMIITPDGRMLMPLAQGTGVLPNDITEKLWDMAKNYTVGNNLPTLSDITTNNNNISYGSLLTVNGDVTKDVLPELQEILKKAYQYTVNEMRKDHRKNGRK